MEAEKILLLYSSHDGHTGKIMATIADELEGLSSCKQHYDLVNIDHFEYSSLKHYQAVIIGTSIRYGHYNKKIKALIEQEYNYLNSIPSAFFGVNLIARKPNKQTPETNSYTYKFLHSIKWQPTIRAVFAGALRYPKYTWFDRIMIQLIMRMTGGETDCAKEIEYTDWQSVKRFSQQCHDLFTLRLQ